jgi:phosphate transport system permease protein
MKQANFQPKIKSQDSRQRIQAWRSTKNKIASILSLLAVLFGIFWLVWILMTIITKGISGISFTTFTQPTPPPNFIGGLSNAITGSGLLIIWSTIIGTPLGVLAGIYLVEYGKKSVIAEIIRFINDILLSAPSIVIGLFVYTVVVANMHHFSGWAGAVSLALLQIPIIIRTTDSMLNLVPDNIREAAYALGAPRWKIILFITLKASRSGIITGVLLAISRITGETAPLLFTALSNQFWSTDMMQPIASLPVTIFHFAMSPFTEWKSLAWAGVLIITICILVLNITARLVLTNSKNGRL